MNENESVVDFGELDLGSPPLDETTDFDLTSFDFTPDPEDLTEVSDFDLDFGSLDDTDEQDETESIFDDATEILRSYADVSSDLISYYQSALNALQKLFVGDGVSTRKLIRPSITEFSYISDEDMRQKVYGYFCQMLEDLVTDNAYANITADKAFQVMCDEVYADLRWTPGIFLDKFSRTFFSVYENNKKLASATAITDTNGVAGLLDKKTLQTSELVFRVNSVPFQAVSRFLSDPSNLDEPEMRLNEQAFGEFGVELKRRNNSKFLTKRMVFSGIIQFLTSEETLRMLGLAETDSHDFSLGELLRRFILKELTDCDFVPMDIDKLPTRYSNDFVSVVVGCLYRAIAQRSFAAEIIFLLMNIMLDNSNVEKVGKRNSFQEFVVGIGQYLSAFCANPAYVNPVFYTLVNRVEGGSDTDFCVTYTEADEVRTANVSGILCEVIGNNRTVYKIPLVHITQRGYSAVCPPREVIDSIDRAVSAGRINIAGDIRYSYTPSYSWLSSLNITVSSLNDEQSTVESKATHTDNPLLAVLMNYQNSFDTSGERPEVISVRGQGVEQMLGVDLHKGEDSSAKILRLVFSDGSIASDGGMFVRDSDDNSLIIRYQEKSLPQGGVLVLKDGDYEFSTHTAMVSEKSCNTELVSALLGVPFSNFTPVVGNSYLRATTQRVCELNAMDYNQQLEEVRSIIIRDLSSVLRLTALDEILSYNSLRLFSSLGEDKLNSFNYQTIQQLFDMMYGIPNELTGVDKIPANLQETLERGAANLQSFCTEICNYFAELHVSELALQAISRGELTGRDEGLYRALHYIPFFHARFRELEDYMVLLRVLDEIGEDIIPIFMKSTVVSNTYREICTKDTIGTLEGKLASASRVKSPLMMTRSVLDSALSEHCIILKYFALDRNPHGVLATLEECIASGGSEQHKEIYAKLKAAFKVDASVTVSTMAEEDICKDMTRVEVERVFTENMSDILYLVYSGLVADVSHNVNLRIVKAFDIFSRCGQFLFGFQKEAIEDFLDTSEFEKDFLTYAGSFMLSFSPIFGEAEDEIDGGMDRASAYYRHRLDFTTYETLSLVEDYSLEDLRHVEGADGSDALLGDSPE